MESTNELVTKAEANAEGLSVDSTNECLTKAEFNANLPTPPQYDLRIGNGHREIIYINNTSDEEKVITINSSRFTVKPKQVLMQGFYSYTALSVYAGSNFTANVSYCANFNSSIASTGLFNYKYSYTAGQVIVSESSGEQNYTTLLIHIIS